MGCARKLFTDFLNGINYRAFVVVAMTRLENKAILQKGEQLAQYCPVALRWLEADSKAERRETTGATHHFLRLRSHLANSHPSPLSARQVE